MPSSPRSTDKRGHDDYPNSDSRALNSLYSTDFGLAMYTRYILLLALAGIALAHKHHNDLTEEEINAPVDTILWIHIFLQVVVWGFLFPIGMVLGITRSKWHVPLQVRIPIRNSSMSS